MIVGNIYLSDVEHKREPLWWHKRGLSFTRSGYGKRIPSETMVRLNKRWRRVYVCIFSNAGTAYVETPKGWLVVND